MNRALTAVTLSLLLTFAASGSQAVVPAESKHYLATLGRVWGVVKNVHPYLGSTEIPWDKAAVRAIERTMTVTDAESFAHVTQEMLDVLGDPATLVERDCVESGTPPAPSPVVTATGALYVPPGATVDADTIRNHPDVVFDLRPQPGRCTSANAAQLETLAPLMFSGSIPFVLQRTITSTGYRSQNPANAIMFYSTGFLMPAMPPFTGSATGTRTTTFVVDRQSALPAVAQAMVQAKQASILSVGPYRDLAMSWLTVPLDGGYHARIRTSEAPATVHARTVLPADATEADILAAAANPPGEGRRRAVRGPARKNILYTWRFDDPYTDMKYPALGYRVLAAYRYWNAIHFFYPYKHLIDPWDAQLEPIIEMMIAPRDQTEYELALTALTKLVPDGHSHAITPARSALFGPASPPFHTMPVEGKVVVTTIVDAAAASAAGVRLGDELLAVDGRPIEERMAELKRYMSASHELHLEYSAAAAAPRGAHGSEALMRFRRADGSEYETRVSRSTGWRVLPDPAQKWRMLQNDIGYVDLNFLETNEVDDMFDDLGGARAIIFDLRGYPRGVFVDLARRMNITGNTVVAQIRIPRMVAGVLTETFDYQELPKNNKPSFKGRTIVLIDERAISHAEHTGLVLETVANATFVGSPTAGANGNVTFLVQPGGHYMMFTGMDIRHGDGRQLQRVGLIPHVPVPRTQAAIAAGRDEVLEAAIEVARR